MKIGELAEQTGLAPSRIRFYERIGLLKTVKRQSNGYRSYPPEAVLVLGMITSAQKAGFSLDELRALLPSDLTQWNHQALTSALRQKIQDIEDIQQRLADSKAQLQKVLTQVEEKPDDMDCAANARRLWSQVGFGEAAERAAIKSSSSVKH
ncbi:MAG: MerR family transcriptional regulator [Pseudomonadaceae bacterium]